MHTLEARTRVAGKANAVRQAGAVPGVVYGPSIESTPIAVERTALQGLFAQITRSSRITLSIAGENETKKMDVFLKVVDYDPVSDEPKHVDFYHPDAGHPVKLEVPVKIVGEAKGVKTGGILNVLFNTIPVHGLPKDVPHLFTIDVSALDMGEGVHIRDIDFGKVESMLPPERTVVTVIAPRGLMTEEEEVEGEEGEEGVEGETAKAAAGEAAEETASEGG
jgi:large subunit ribosomal protein L25